MDIVVQKIRDVDLGDTKKYGDMDIGVQKVGIWIYRGTKIVGMCI